MNTINHLYNNTVIFYWLNRLRFILPYERYPLRRGESICPFFIIGSGRSGNTMLRRVLFNHSDLHIPPETYVLGHVIKLFNINRNLAWKDIVYATFAQFEFHPEFETFGISLRPMVQELIDTPESLRSLSYILDRFYRYHAAQHGVQCSRWGDKTPLNTFYLDRILSVFPDAQFIHMVRDGCDVAASYCDAGLYKDVSLAGKRWVNAIKAARKFMKANPNQCLEIRYEEFVCQPERTTKRLCDFLDVAYEPEMLDFKHSAHSMGDVAMRAHHKNVSFDITPKSIGAGRTKLTIEQKKKLQPIIDKLLRELGYKPCTS